ncbi:hypothetical protein [Verrucomicrobium sp. BvORR106]|uniref:hypothetical protein n=1 Tax=Verrucomicrobium sp. BvORR106 TaxID=1403819 RepID=UPI002240FC0C|nr:hypothetical protein [Verrucomicrobium sp. BvORR106]
MSEVGLHYVATGLRHLQEAVASRRSAKLQMPGLPAAIFTDLVDHPLAKEFDFVFPVVKAEHSFHDVVEPLLRSPFEKTLHLDTDTYVCDDCSEIFEALNHFEIAVVHDPWRSDLAIETLPQSLPTINGGVIAYRITPSVRALLESWPRIHKEKFACGTRQNQPSLREAVYLSDARVLILPPEYNLRVWHPVAIGGFSKVKIIHDRRSDLPRLAKELNQGHKPRVFGRIDWRLYFYYLRSRVFKVVGRMLGKTGLKSKFSF